VWVELYVSCVQPDLRCVEPDILHGDSVYISEVEDRMQKVPNDDETIYVTSR
jgi:hypothetical protein